MTLREALILIGLPGDYDPGRRGAVGVMLTRCKELMVAAEGDHEARVRLSQAKERFKAVSRRVCICGKRKYPKTVLCPQCRLEQGVRVPVNHCPVCAICGANVSEKGRRCLKCSPGRRRKVSGLEIERRPRAAASSLSSTGPAGFMDSSRARFKD